MKRNSHFDCLLFLMRLKDVESDSGCRRCYDCLISFCLDRINLIDFIRYKENF